MNMRNYHSGVDCDDHRGSFEEILDEVAATGASLNWTPQPPYVSREESSKSECLLAKIEIRLRSFGIGYVRLPEGGADGAAVGTWTRIPGGTTYFWPPIDPPRAPAETRRRIAAIPIEDRCCGDCKTWFVLQDEPGAVRCDECWSGKAEPIDDDDVMALPEAQVAVLVWIVEEMPDIFLPPLEAVGDEHEQPERPEQPEGHEDRESVKADVRRQAASLGHQLGAFEGLAGGSSIPVSIAECAACGKCATIRWYKPASDPRRIDTSELASSCASRRDENMVQGG